MTIPTLHIDVSDLVEAGKANVRGPAAVKQAAIRAINRGGDAGFVTVRDRLIETTGLAKAKVTGSKGLTRSRAYNGNPSFEVKARGPFTPLSYFKPEQADGGVSAAPWNRRQTFPRTFMLTFSNGYRGVFKRDTTAARRTYPGRGGGKGYSAKPIVELWGPTLGRELLRNGIPEAFNKKATSVVEARISHELAFALGKIKPRARK